MAEDQALCGAKKSDGGECRNTAGYRTPHPGRGPCYRHFGCTPAVTQKYITEEAIENAYAAGFRGNSVEIGPHEALLEEVRRTGGKVRYLSNMLDFADLEPAVQVGFERTLCWERAHLVTVCGVAARAGVEERQISLAETWGAEIAAVMSRIFEELGLTDEQNQRAPEIVQRHLILLEGTG